MADDDARDTRTPEEKRDAAHAAIGIDPATGFATDGEWPINGRLRAEAMATAGVLSDPAGIVTDELIASTKDRLAAEKAEADRVAAEEEKARAAAPSMKWTEDRLRKEAERLGLTVETDANKAAILAAIEAAPPAPQTEA